MTAGTGGPAEKTKTTAAVYLGAVLFVALPVTIVLSSAIVAGLEAVGPSPAESGWLGAAILGLSFVVGLQFAVEAAVIHRHGLAALRRGRPERRQVRVLTLVGSGALGLGLATWYGLTLVVGEPTWYAAVLGGLVTLSTLVAFVRASSAIVGDLRSIGA